MPTSDTAGRGPDLTGALATEGWRRAIASENAMADKLAHMLQKRELLKISSVSSLAGGSLGP